MSRFLNAVGVVALLVPAYTLAQTYQTVYDDGRMAVVKGSVDELSLPDGEGSGGFQVTLPTGYAGAQIFLTNYLLQFTDGAAHSIKRTAVKLDASGGYTSGTGVLNWSGKES